jgi:hypothetical protein
VLAVDTIFTMLAAAFLDDIWEEVPVERDVKEDKEGRRKGRKLRKEERKRKKRRDKKAKKRAKQTKEQRNNSIIRIAKPHLNQAIIERKDECLVLLT